MPWLWLPILLFFVTPVLAIWITNANQSLQLRTVPAWPSAVAVSGNGKWQVVAFVSDPSWIEIWDSHRLRKVIFLDKPDRTNAVHISNKGDVTAGLSRMATRVPFISIFQMRVDRQKLKQCKFNLADPYVSRPKQRRGVQDIAVKDLVVFVLTVEGEVHRINLPSCELVNLKGSADGDTERKGNLIVDSKIVSATVENKIVGNWTWNGEMSRSDPAVLCKPQALNLSTTEKVRQQVNSLDCQVSLVLTASDVYKCESGNCQSLMQNHQQGELHN